MPKEIVIETPYFLPGTYMRKALIEAAQRGVNVKIISPQHSDVNVVDMLRNKYIGEMHKGNVEILFYAPKQPSLQGIPCGLYVLSLLARQISITGVSVICTK